MNMEGALRNRFRQAAPALALALLGVAACLRPSVPGYQVRGVPEGFLFNANANTGVNILPDRDILSRGVWMGDLETFEPQSQIYVTRYAGTATIEEARTARDVQAGRYGNPASIEYAEVETVTIDERPAFTWMEIRYDEHEAIRSLEYKAVIPYDTVSYSVEFNTSAPHRLHPDSLTRVVHSWGRGETEVLWGTIFVAGAVLVGLAALLVFWARR